MSREPIIVDPANHLTLELKLLVDFRPNGDSQGVLLERLTRALGRMLNNPQLLRGTVAEKLEQELSVRVVELYRHLTDDDPFSWAATIALASRAKLSDADLQDVLEEYVKTLTRGEQLALIRARDPAEADSLLRVYSPTGADT